ncbi:hypothetical protein [Streptomyces sp. NPDC059994]|uniref:hypothetical protein n=1 Tax=Streptomyces sp. NPDC059994 TaxID=3347029 RepID=UPI0036BF5D0C
MSDNRDDGTTGTVIDFGRRTGLTGFTITQPAPVGDDVTSPVIPAQPGGEPTNGTGRRSPLSALAALPSTTLTAAPVVATHADGGLPETFRNPGSGDRSGPRLGALSLAATLAVAVAALRGSCIVLEDWRQRRMAKAAEAAPLREARAKHKLAMAQARFASAEASARKGGATGDKAAKHRSKRVPDSHAFGQKTLGNRSGKGGGRGGKGAGSATGTGSGGADRKRKDSAAGGRGRKGTGHKNGPGVDRDHKKDNGLAGGKGTKSSHRGSQGTGLTMKKNSAGRTRLPEALKNDTSKAAKKRLKRRRKDLDTPALWKADDRSKPQRKNVDRKGNNSPTGNKASRRKKAKRQPDMSKLRNALWHDTKAAADGRWTKRNGGGTPPLWKNDKQRKRRQKAQSAKANTPKSGSPKSGSGGNGERWRRARERARAASSGRPDNGGNFTGAAPGSTQTGTGGSSGPAGERAGGRRGTRRSPFENAGQAGAPTWTVVERMDYVGAQAKRWEPNALEQGQRALTATGQPALPAAPEPHTQRPGTTRPKEPIPMPPAPLPAHDSRLQKARNGAARRAQAVIRQARHMDPQHATEITLDDALDEYGDFKDDGFKTHEQSAKLAARARQLAATLEAFAEDLATHHNLIGALFTGAMANLSEDMELVARMSEEMQVSSLQAAEDAEQADNDLNDAYRPITQATADAGLTTPSAPIHNQS